MVLKEAPSEKNQPAWYSHLAQERRELSFSVGGALVDTPLQESFWLDDQSQHATVGSAGVRNHVFPPRLSLQSRSLPGTPFRAGTGLVNTHSNTMRRTNIWTRFVSRLRSSLSAFRFHSSVEDNTTIPPVIKENRSMHSMPVEETLCSSGGNGAPGGGRMSSATTHEMSSKSECRVVTGTNTRRGSLRSTQGRRLAGRATRIRLEVMPAPSSGAIPNNAKNSLDMTVPGVAAFVNNGGTSVRLPAIEKITRRPVEDRALVDSDGGTTSIRLPVVEKVTRLPIEDRTCVDSNRETSGIRLPAAEKVVRRREEPSPARCAGTGMFECGQRDVTISDPSVAASSVVLVTLTANPGPVVVQYVSLQPRIGFTVHLTAPTTMSAPFNYLVL